MIEPDWVAARGHENGDAIADDHRSGVIDFKSFAVEEFHGVDVEGLHAIQLGEHPIKIIGGHNGHSLELR